MIFYAIFLHLECLFGNSFKSRMKRHSQNCPCDEHVKVQSEFFGDFVKKLIEANPEKQKHLLESSPLCFTQFMCNCAKGVLKGDIKLSKKRLQKLSPDKNVLMKLVRPSISLQKKKDYFIKEQRGGFLGILAGIVASALSSILGTQLSKIL